MKNIKILIGVSGSGKSRYSKSLTEKVFSSDDIRKELFGSFEKQDKDSHQKVFSVLHERILKYDEDSIYDATNLNRRRRAVFYRESKSKIHAVIFIEPLTVLFDNNDKKPADQEVPDEVIRRMYGELQTPRVGVDCDSYEIQSRTNFFKKSITYSELVNLNSFDELFKLMSPEYKMENTGNTLPHDTPYHLETIEEHINMCIKNSTDDFTKIVALFHDLGKSVTKNGGKYYGHEKVSAVYAMKAFSEIRDMPNGMSEDLVEAINQHMNAHQGIREKISRSNNIDAKLLEKIEQFREIDSKSRISEIKKEYL